MTDQITNDWDDASITGLIRSELKLLRHTETAVDWGASIVERLRKEGLLPSVEGAHAVLRAECDKLAVALVAKGYPGAHAEIWIGWLGNEVVVQLLPGVGKKFPSMISTSSFSKATISEAYDKALAAIGSLPAPDIECDPDLCGPWFALPQAEAAE